MVNVIEYLEQTAEQYPDKNAFVDEHKSITFRQLRTQARGIATVILKATSQRINVPIAILMDKSVDMLLAFMAVTYSANFYVPLDTASPVPRLAKIVEILCPKIVITSLKYQEEAQELGLSKDMIMIFEDLVDADVDDTKISAALSKKIDTDPIYALFTSGSTGTPKGVITCHRSVIDYIEWACNTFSTSAEDSLGNQAPFYFVNSVFDIYSTLKTGATLYIVPKKLFMFPAGLINYLNENKINTIYWVPSALIYIVNTGILEELMPKYLKRIIFSGEVMPNKQLNQWRRALPDLLYAYLYGSTEITVDCTYFIVDRLMEDNEPLPIGIPCANTDIIVLNDRNELVSGDEQGELCVRGSSLALGYYGDPEKTAAVFVQNPLNPFYPELIYRTGDIVKYNERHELIYLCRKDFQIKHMGHRIEPGEIETAVLALPEVQNGCIVYDDKENKIVLFYQAAKNIDREIVRELRGQLPKYMLPNRLIWKESLPMNQNGKIDRVALKKSL